MFRAWILGIWPTLLKWGAIAAAVGAVILKIRKDGADAERAKRREELDKGRDVRDTVQEDTSRLSDLDAVNQLRNNWSRD